MSSLKPTAEQEYMIEKFLTGDNLLGNAYAGTGKTSTGVMMTSRTNRSGVYVAFNKSIATDAAGKFPANVMCKTGHSFAYGSVIRQYGFSSTKMGGKVNGAVLAQKMSLEGIQLGETQFSPRQLGTLVAETVARYCRSGSEELTDAFVPYDGAMKTLDDSDARKLDTFVHELARRAWAKMIDPRAHDWPLGHDGYLKLWALGKPQLAAPGKDAFGGFVILDEAQDTNGVMLQVMREQECQVVAIGDRHQQIYEWRGAVNAMTALRGPGVNEARLSTSWRFGPNVAGYATELLTLLGETVPLTGNPDREDRVVDMLDCKADCILARTNAGVISQLFKALEAGRRPCLLGGVNEMLTYIRAAESLQAGRSVESPMDFFGFKDWSEVVEASENDGGLKKWVNLIEGYGTERLKTTLQKLPDEHGADLIITTGHKSKGREWNNVRLCDDFLMGAEPGKSAKDGKIDFSTELRLYYVAATRAQKQLEVPPALEDKMETVEMRHQLKEETGTKAA